MLALDTSGAVFQPVAPLSTRPRTSMEVIAAQTEATMARGLPMIWDMPGIGKEKGVPLALAAGGPSLRTTMRELHDYQGQAGNVVACGSSHDYLVTNGIVPRYCVVCDPDAISADFLTRASPGTVYLIASCCHADVFDALYDRRVFVWHSAGMCGRDRDRMIAGGCTVTLKTINLAIVLGYSDLHFFGFDSSFADGDEHAYAHSFGPRETIDIRVNGTGRVFKTSTEFLAQAQHFQEMLASEGHLFTATVHGDGMIAEMMRVGANFQAHEREKYRRIWEEPRYRLHSIGEDMVGVAHAMLGMRPGDTVIDFGCGPGRAVKIMRTKLKLDAVGVDFAANAPEGLGLGEFICADITEPLPGGAMWGYCTDVMEHLAGPMIDGVLANIASCTRGAFFTIALGDENMGTLIGEKLHLTVQPAEWWAERLREYWPDVRWQEDRSAAIPRMVAACFHEVKDV